jgi:serine protease inhibitor
MTPRRAGLVLHFLVAPLVTCCEPSLPPPRPESVAPWNAAAMKVFAATCKHDAGNVGLFVPALLPMLSLLTEGARGATREQLVAILGTLDHESNRRRLHALAELDDAEFDCGFKAWIDQGLVCEPDWLDLATRRDRYAGSVDRVAFATADGARVARDVDEWIGALVKEPVHALSAEEVTPLTRLLLASAARVRWEWTKQFEPRSTRPTPFFDRPDRKVGRDVPTMHGEQKNARTGELDGCTVVELACNGGLRLDVVEVGGDLARRDTLLAGADFVGRLDAALGKSGSHEIDLALPKLATSSLHDLAPVLQALGARDAFAAAADLSGIGGKPGELMLSLLRHGCGVEWDEKGGRASGFTVGGVVAAEVAAPIEIDEPFLAFLRAPDGALLLVEWIERPDAR